VEDDVVATAERLVVVRGANAHADAKRTTRTNREKRLDNMVLVFVG
jgi:hypothetical protein